MSGGSSSPGGLVRLLKPVGPVAGRFGASRAFIAGIMGPVGGGKTTECIAKGFRVGLLQKPVWDASRGCHVKKCRGAVVRDTYPNLDRTVIKSWHQWFPKSLGRWSGEAPRMHSFTLNIGKPGTPGYHQLDMEVIFTAIGDKSVEDVLRGLELTWLWPNEWDLLPQTILEIGAGRVGRYPGAIDGGCQFAQIFGDFNAPEEDNHVVKLFGIEDEIVIDPALAEALKLEAGDDRPLVEFFEQPGGLDPDAENLHNLPPIIEGNPRAGRAYYLKQAALLQSDMCRRMVHNKIGPIRHGTPVYPEFLDDLKRNPAAPHGHVRHFEPDRRLPLLIFADQDICPGAVFAQLDPMLDQLRIIDELARIFENEKGQMEVAQMGGEAFGRECAILAGTRYPGLRIGLAGCDPAGSQGEQAIEHTSWRRAYQKGLGVQVRPVRVPGNALEPRLTAMRTRLNGTVRGEPKFLIHPRCTILRKAFNTKYAWQRVSMGSIDGGRFGSKPLKIQGYADVMNAAEYCAWQVEHGVSIDATGPAAGRRGREIKSDSDYAMHGGR